MTSSPSSLAFLFLYSFGMHLIDDRKVIREMASGGRDAERVKLKLEVKVQEV